jgi:hypothetical protein
VATRPAPLAAAEPAPQHGDDRTGAPRPTAPRSLPATATDVLASLYQHRLMTTAQIHDLHHPGSHITWTRRVLRRLAALHLADHVPRSDKSHRPVWFVTDSGAAAVEEAGQVVTRTYRLSREGAAGPLQAHTLGCNDIGLAFVRAARALGDDCGPLSWHHEWAARIADRGTSGRWSNLLTSDLLLRYLHRGADGEQSAVRLIEYDRSHRDLDDVVAQLRAYARFYAYKPAGQRHPHWQDDYATFPRVLLVLDRGSPRALTARRQSLTWMCREDPLLTRHTEPLGLLATTLADLTAHGPWAPIFWPLTQRDADAPEGPVTWTGHTALPEGGPRR